MWRVHIVKYIEQQQPPSDNFYSPMREASNIRQSHYTNYEYIRHLAMCSRLESTSSWQTCNGDLRRPFAGAIQDGLLHWSHVTNVGLVVDPKDRPKLPRDSHEGTVNSVSIYTNILPPDCIFPTYFSFFPHVSGARGRGSYEYFLRLISSWGF